MKLAFLHHSQNQLEINNKDLSLKSVTIKHLEENIESKHFDIGLINSSIYLFIYVLDMSSQTRKVK